MNPLQSLESSDDAPEKQQDNPLLETQSLLTSDDPVAPAAPSEHANPNVIDEDEDLDWATYRSSVWVMIIINMLDNINYAICLPSLWPYIQSLRGSRDFYGWCVSAYSLAQFISSPFFGYVSNFRSYREVFVISMLIESFSCFLYAFAQDPLMILMSRILVGFSAGNVAVTRTYIVRVTNQGNRVLYISLVAIAQVFGFVLGPAVGAALSRIPSVFLSRYPHPRIVLDEYTSVGFLCATICFLCTGLIFFFLRDLPVVAPKKKLKRKTLNKSEADEVIHSATTTTITPHAAAYQQNTQAEDTPTTSVVVAYPLVDDTVIAAPHKHHEAKWKGIVRHIAACGSLVIYFVSVSGFTVFETIGTPLTEDLYKWQVWQISIMYIIAAVLSILSFVLLQVFARCFSEKFIMLASLVIMGFGFGIVVPAPIPVYRLYLCVVLLSFSVPIAQALVLSIFTKLLPKHNQGVANGIMSSACSLSRIVAPLWATELYSHFGSIAVFGVNVGFSLVAIAVNVVCYGMFIPHPSQEGHHGTSLPAH